MTKQNAKYRKMFKQEKERLKFVSYDGEYPTLCHGTLKMRLDGKIITFPKHCLMSGGNVTFDKNWMEEITEGKWEIIEFPPNFPKHLEREAERLVNEEVPWGCCGGCV